MNRKHIVYMHMIKILSLLLLKLYLMTNSFLCHTSLALWKHHANYDKLQ